MGTWGYCLLDNDAALDTVDELLAYDSDSLPVPELVSRMALAIWFGSFDFKKDWPNCYERATSFYKTELTPNSQITKDLAFLAERQDRIYQDSGSRSPQLKNIIGNSCDGPLFEALILADKSGGAIRPLFKQCCQVLTEIFDDGDLHSFAGKGATALTILLHLQVIAVAPARTVVSIWQRAFDELVLDVDPEAEVSEEFVAKVREGFGQLAKCDGKRGTRSSEDIKNCKPKISPKGESTLKNIRKIYEEINKLVEQREGKVEDVLIPGGGFVVSGHELAELKYLLNTATEGRLATLWNWYKDRFEIDPTAFNATILLVDELAESGSKDELLKVFKWFMVMAKNGSGNNRAQSVSAFEEARAFAESVLSLSKVGCE